VAHELGHWLTLDRDRNFRDQGFPDPNLMNHGAPVLNEDQCADAYSTTRALFPPPGCKGDDCPDAGLADGSVPDGRSARRQRGRRGLSQRAHRPAELRRLRPQLPWRSVQPGRLPASRRDDSRRVNRSPGGRSERGVLDQSGEPIHRDGPPDCGQRDSDPFYKLATSGGRLAASASRLYWSEPVTSTTPGSIVGAPLGDGAQADIEASDQHFPGALRVAGGGLFWANSGGKMGTTGPS